MEDILDVAIYIKRQLPFSTDKQIQKITYYAYSWFIVKNNKDSNSITNRLFEPYPQAWVHGPVFQELYEEMTYFRRRFLERQENLKQSTKDFLDKIICIYGKYTGNQLEDLTHSEMPWIEARAGYESYERSNMPIKDKIIFEYYSQ